MKKQIKPALYAMPTGRQAGRKLRLNKSTISNLGITQMSGIVGGTPHTLFCEPTDNCTVKKCYEPTHHGHTCNGNNC